MLSPFLTAFEEVLLFLFLIWLKLLSPYDVLAFIPGKETFSLFGEPPG